MQAGQRFLMRTRAEGVREVSWRLWVLVWVLPACFALGALWQAVEVLYTRSVTEVATGTVVHVYEWDSENPFDEGPKVYSPRYRYVWTDGQPTEATAGVSSALWNFPIGTEKQIRFRPDRKDDVTLTGPTEWLIARVIAIIALCLLPLSLAGTWWLRRWQARGQQSPLHAGAVRRM